MNKQIIDVGTVTLNKHVRRNVPYMDNYGWRTVVTVEVGTYPLKAELEGGSLTLLTNITGIVTGVHTPVADGKSQSGAYDSELGQSREIRLPFTPESFDDPRFRFDMTKDFLAVENGDFVLDVAKPDFQAILHRQLYEHFEKALGMYETNPRLTKDYNPEFAEMAGFLEEPKLSQGFALGSAQHYMKVIAMDSILREYAGKSLDEAGIGIADAFEYTKGFDGSLRHIALKGTRTLMQAHKIQVLDEGAKYNH